MSPARRVRIQKLPRWRKSTWRQQKESAMPMHGKRTLFAILLPLVVFGCATKMRPLTPYECQVPDLTYTPMIKQCEITTVEGQRKTIQCIILLDTDFYEVIIDLKACCIGSGKTREQCQAQERVDLDDVPPPIPMTKEL